MAPVHEKLAAYVRSLANFRMYEAIDGCYNHMGATIADAVLHANNRYESNVTPRVQRILREYPDAKTTSAVLLRLQTVPATTFLNWAGEDRATRFRQVADLFKSQGVEDEGGLRTWLTIPLNCAKLDAIYGIGQKTVDYFKILCGESTSAIDRHLLAFLELAGIRVSSYSEAQGIINTTSDLLGIDRACFDHSIWQFMRARTVGCGAQVFAGER